MSLVFLLKVSPFQFNPPKHTCNKLPMVQILLIIAGMICITVFVFLIPVGDDHSWEHSREVSAADFLVKLPTLTSQTDLDERLIT